MITKILGAITASSPGLKRTLWKRWYEFLAGGYGQDDWTFMNYGFAGLDSQGPRLDLEPDDDADRYSIQLYHEVAASDIDISGKDVLEVGSGRGGGSSYMARYLRPRSLVGVDFSDKAVSLSQKRHNVSGLSFRQGDAESLPFKDGSFDVVVNVESSHCYGSMERFLGEVARVLRPGGFFVWADMCGRAEHESLWAQFRKAGLEERRSENMTPNVVLALDRISDRKREMIGRYVPKFMMSSFEDFAGVRGTRVYESLRAGNVEYWRCTLQKPTSDVAALKS